MRQPRVFPVERDVGTAATKQGAWEMKPIEKQGDALRCLLAGMCSAMANRLQAIKIRPFSIKVLLGRKVYSMHRRNMGPREHSRRRDPPGGVDPAGTVSIDRQLPRQRPG